MSADVWPDELSPFAKQARALCPEPTHDDRLPCPMCRALESRLTPVSEVLRAVLDDAGLTLTVRWSDYYREAGA